MALGSFKFKFRMKELVPYQQYQTKIKSPTIPTLSTKKGNDPKIKMHENPSSKILRPKSFKTSSCLLLWQKNLRFWKDFAGRILPEGS
jgi:hypothetical protein